MGRNLHGISAAPPSTPSRGVMTSARAGAVTTGVNNAVESSTAFVGPGRVWRLTFKDVPKPQPQPQPRPHPPAWRMEAPGSGPELLSTKLSFLQEMGHLQEG